MALDIAGALEAVEDEGVFEAADDVFDNFGLAGVMFAAADNGVKDFDEVEDVFLDFGPGGAAEVEEIEEFDFKADALAADHDVVVVDVAVIFAAGVDGGDPFGQDVEHMKGFEGAEALVGLGGHEIGEFLAFDEFADDDGDFAPADVGGLLMVVLHEDRAVAQCVEFTGVADGGFAERVAVGVIEFGGAADAGGALDDGVNLAFPATSEKIVDRVLPRDRPAGREVESANFSGTIYHVQAIVDPTRRGVNCSQNVRGEIACAFITLLCM